MKLAILLICAPVLWGCAKTRDSTQGVSKICPVHHIAMEKRSATIVDHGDIRADLIKDALLAQRAGIKDVYATLFPFVETRAHTHRDAPPPSIVLIYVCPECVRARDSWRNGKKG